MKYRLIAAIAMIAAVASGVRADEGDDGGAYSRRLFGGDFGKRDKSYACFVRRYDAAHLARHNLQKVSDMLLLVSAEKDEETKNVNYSFRLGLKFRNRKGAFDSSGSCGHASASQVSADKLQINCGVDCDGGGITVELANDDKSMLIRLDAIRIWQNNKPDDEGFSLSGGADDRVFRLDRVDVAQCRSLVTDRKELAAMRHK